MQLANKTIVVTGAGGGIGRELSVQLAQRGANVAGVDINPETLDETGRIIGTGQGQFKGDGIQIPQLTGNGCGAVVLTGLRGIALHRMRLRGKPKGQTPF